MSTPLLVSSLALMVVVVTIVASVPGTLAQTTSYRQALRKYFGCPDCDQSNCPGTSPVGCELVLEPGVCACCQVCARLEGQSCGLTSGRCGQKLACRPMPDDSDPIGAILDGRAVCLRVQ
ncbi:insulin-like growth factor-binding protein 5 [Pomacea canaliculata]|uniref:insulin-like growth factor-binding protein 5 n=1 Tax=Pomacea canaliculata TaxID=400727 RepID=UPI000D732FA0|nr:insulin-like growth factor-binding protein 5 [Pomacea canaliculata]